MSDTLTRESFDPHVSKAFRVRDSQHVLTLLRIEGAREDDGRAIMGLRPPFNLIFTGAAGNVLAEGTHTLETGEGVAFELYVIPIHTPARDRQDYQSSFT